MNVSTPPETLRTLDDLIEMKAAGVGDSTYIRDEGGETVSFAQLDEKATTVAKNLSNQGISSGDHVCLYMSNCVEYLYLYFGIAKLGAVVVPIDTRFTEEELIYILREVEGNTIIFDEQTRDQYEEVRSKQTAMTAEYCVNSCGGTHPYQSFSKLTQPVTTSNFGSSACGTDPLSVIYVQRQPQDAPTGVILPHYAYVNTGWIFANDLLNLDDSDRILTPIPLYSMVAAQMGMVGSLIAECEFIPLSRFEPRDFWKQVNRYSPNVLIYLSRVISVLHNHKSSKGNEQNPLDLAVGYGFGFGTDEQLIRAFEDRFNITVLEGYGTTQGSTIASLNTTEDRRIGSAGKPAPHVDVQIVDEDDWPLPPGEIGEIVVRPTVNNTMMIGYHNKPQLTAEDFRNQWIHTGDSGYFDEDGYLFFVAKRENSIYQGQIIGRISTLEIESVINGHPAVRTSVVTGITTADDHEEIIAVVIPADGHSLNPADVYQYCKKQLPYLKIPRYIDIRSSLPRTPTGKIKADAIKDIDLKRVWDRESGYEFAH